jgi:DNA-binding SARP family transcriptional activator
MTEALRLHLLGGFRAERGALTVPDGAWHRRSAKRLTKLLAAHPAHSLHREQILEILWPDVDMGSSLNSFGKALHAARRAFEPDRPARDNSAYLRLKDDVLTLDPDLVVVDADDFEWLAKRALTTEAPAAYEVALAAYPGELLPEDLYEDWCQARRRQLAELHVFVLTGLAEVLERGGAYARAVEHLRRVLQDDPTREDVYRRLMRLYVEMGARGLAIRQFEICRTVLREVLEMAPDRETEALYQDILRGPVQPWPRGPERRAAGQSSRLVLARPGAEESPFVGRVEVLDLVADRLAQAKGGVGGLVMVSGEAGIGKSRLVSEFVAQARDSGVSVLGNGGETPTVEYGPFVAALEDYFGDRSAAERRELALRYPGLGHLSSFGQVPVTLTRDRRNDLQLHLGIDIVRLLDDLAQQHLVLVVLGDLDDADSSSLALLEYLAHLAPRRRLLLIATLRDEAIGARDELRRMVESTACDDRCVRVELPRLGRPEHHELIGAMLRPGPADPILLDEVYALTLGNPLFAREFALDVHRRAQAGHVSCGRPHTATARLRLPGRLGARVMTAVTPLDRDVRQLLEVAAVAGDGISLAVLRRAAGSLRPALDGPEFCVALDRALATRILVQEAPDCRFRHPLIQRALVEALSERQRAAIRTALESSGYAGRDQGPSQERGLTRVSGF